MNHIEEYLLRLYTSLNITFAEFALYHCAYYLSFGFVSIHVRNDFTFSKYANLRYVSVPSLL